MKVARYLIFFTIASFLFSGVFACHTYIAEAADFALDYSDSCEDEEEVLVNQNEIQSSQKSISDFNLMTLEKLSGLVPGISINFTFSENLNNSQTGHLLTIVKIE